MKQLTRMKMTSRGGSLTWAVLFSALALLTFMPLAQADPQGPWKLPASNLSAAGQNAGQPQVAIGPDGTTTAVWQNYNGSGTGATIKAAIRPAGGSFGAATTLSAPGQSAYSPQIAIGPNGTATAVWYRSNGIEGIVQAATRPPGGSFGTPVNLSAAGRFANDPQIAIAPNGATTVVWSTYVDGFNDRIQFATRPPGGSFGAEANLSAVGESASSPQIATAPDGDTTVVWYLYKGSASRIQSATWPSGGSFGAVVNLSAAGEDDVLPQIAIAPDGTTTVVWQLYKSPDIRIQSATRPPGGSFGGPVNLSAAGQNAFSPQIAVAPDGTATVVWQGFNGTNRIIRAATRPPGGSFGAAVDLSAAGQNASGPQIAVARDGTSTVVWDRSDGSHEIIQAATRPPEGSFGAPVSLSAAGRNASFAQIAIAPNGTATAVWRRFNGSNTVIQGASTAQPSRIGKVGVSGPARIRKGRAAIYTVRITNSGRAVATGVRLMISGRGTAINAPVGRIAVGATRTVNVRFRLSSPGRVVATFRVTSFNAGGRTVRKTITVSR
jgi:hypothetical protein